MALSYTGNNITGNVVTLSDCALFDFEVTGTSASQIIKGWWQVRESGSAIGVKEYVPDGNYSVSFLNEISRVLETDYFPGLPYTHADAVGLLDILYGTQTTSLDPCLTTESTGGNTPDYYVVNAKMQAGDDFNFNNPVVLSRRPQEYTICETQDDMLTVWGGNSGTTFDITGRGIGQTTTINVPALSVYTFAIPYVSGGNVITFTINEVEYTINVESNCCCDGEWAEVHFLENLGGWSSVSFKCLGGAGAIRQNDLICVSNSCTGSGRGTTVFNAKSKPVITLIAELDVNKFSVAFWNEFFTSTKHYLKVINSPFISGDLFVEYTVDNGDYQIYREGETVIAEINMTPVNYNVLV
jgi:hypothetical protein